MPKAVYCRKCGKWVTAHPEGAHATRREHDRWCGLDREMVETHPDLVDLEAFVKEMFE